MEGSLPNSVLEGKTNPAIITIRCPDIGDLGDAPDSSNHHGLDNTAYAPPSGSPILGQFPTVWGIAGPSTAPSGPFHRNPYKAHLGRAVSAEFDADLVPDVDGVTNILDGMTDLSIMDQFDDGWLNKGVFMQHCKETTLKVLVTKNDPAVNKMLLNVWFDGNRDGDWADKVECADVTFNDQQPGLTPIASEHIVDNFIVDMSGWDQGESREIIMRTRLIRTNSRTRSAGFVLPSPAANRRLTQVPRFRTAVVPIIRRRTTWGKRRIISSAPCSPKMGIRYFRARKARFFGIDHRRGSLYLYSDP